MLYSLTLTYYYYLFGLKMCSEKIIVPSGQQNREDWVVACLLQLCQFDCGQWNYW